MSIIQIKKLLEIIQEPQYTIFFFQVSKLFLCAPSTETYQIDLRQKVCTPWCKYYITNQYIPYYSHFLIELLIQKTTKPLEIKRFALYQNHCSYLSNSNNLDTIWRYLINAKLC